MQKEKTRKTGWQTGALLAILAVVILGWWVWQSSGPKAPLETENDSLLSAQAAGDDSAVSPDKARPEESPPEAVEFTALEQYKESTRYPPITRRLSEDSHDLLNPGARYEQRHALPGDKDNHDLEWEVLFTADRFFVQDKEPVLISLQLWNKGDAVLASSAKMTAEAIGPVSRNARVNLSLQSDGAARTAVFEPNSYWPDYVGQVRVNAEFSAEGLAAQNGSLDFYFTSASKIPARFNGRFTDRLGEGDLLINVGLDVRVAGTYRIDANLYDQSGRPFGWARFEGALAAGEAVATLRYYGLLFHDAEAEGRFILKDLNGYRLRPESIPHREDIPKLASDYQTGHYSLAGFHSEINDSPRRQRMIRMYEEAQRRGVKLTRPEFPGDG